MVNVKAYLPEECNIEVSWREQDAIPKLERTHPVFTKDCSDRVGFWLLDTDGIVHWDAYSGPY